MDKFTTFTRHGGALDAAHRCFPTVPQPWLDLSTGINPVAYPVGSLPGTSWTRLPEAAGLRRLEDIAARRYGVPPEMAAVAVPGTQSIIQLLPALYGGRDVRVLGPTYGEFAHVFLRAERHVRVLPILDALAGADVAVVVNPNNPDGRLVPGGALLEMAGRVGTLVVDEAFVDLLPPAASVAARATARMIVLRSFGKTYGLAGLRLGFAIASVGVGAALRTLLGPWAVGGPALAVGATALSDEPWLEATRARLSGDVLRLNHLLRRAGATVLGGTPLFSLVGHASAAALFTHLAEAGILTRPFAEAPDRLRFGLPGNEADWTRLEATLATFG